VSNEEPKLGLECSECGQIVESIEDARDHERELSTDDEPHGGWDTVEVTVFGI
jgi:hypothetical protein